MINLIIFISALVLGIFIVWFRHNFLYNINWSIKSPEWARKHHTSIELILAVLQFISFFSVGFFKMETIKYFSRQTTMIF